MVPPVSARQRVRLPEKATAYLLRQGILSAREALEQGVRLTTSGGERAVTVKAQVGAGGGYVVKLGRRSGRDWVRREIRCYLATSALASAPSITPEVLRADDREAILVTRLVDAGRTLHDYYLANRLDAEAAVTGLARTLAALHTGTVDVAGDVPRDMPWILSATLARRPSASEDPSAMWELFGQSVQRQTLLHGIEAAARCWRKVCLIHGDVKWDNCLLAGEADGGRVLLVDWELGTRGDPAWDIATAVQEFFLVSHGRGENALSSALRPEVRRAIGRLVSSYARHAGLERTELHDLVERTSTFVGSRLIQSAYEFATIEDGLGARATGALGLAESICRSPRALTDELRRAMA